jgi:hypothetical protein
MASPRWVLWLVAISAVLLLAESRAWAAATEIVSLDRQPDGTLKCVAASGGSNGMTGGAAMIQVKSPPQVTLKSYDVGAGATAKANQQFTGDIAKAEGVTAGTQFSLDVTVTDGGHDAKITCSITVPTSGTGGQLTSTDAARDIAAMEYWQRQDGGVKAMSDLVASGSSRGLPPNTAFLVHLPSGAPAFPFPNSLREGTPMQVVVIAALDQPEPIDISVTACADIQTFRVKPADTSGKQAAAFALIPVGAWFKCGAGTATYSLKFGGDTGRTTTTSVRMRSVYHFAATLIVGYDTAPTASFGTSTQGGAQHVVENDSRVGLAAYIGGVWMVGGVDYEDMKFYNYFLNPFIAVNPTAPTKDAIVGLALTPTGGISIALGVSLHEKTVLNGMSVGDAFTGSGSVPTRDSWGDVSPGFFAGVAVDSNVYNAVKSLAGTK